MSGRSSVVKLVDAEDRLLGLILEKARRWSGCDFTRYNRGTMSRRVARRMVELRCGGLEEYIAYLDTHAQEEYPRLVSALTIKVSRFFRDKEVFHALAHKVIPGIFEHGLETGRRTFRAWSAACARGEEVYSLAILVTEHLASLPGGESSRWNITIAGTDIDDEALAQARRGMYSLDELAGLPLEWRMRYFTRVSGNSASLCRVAPELKEMACFSSFDLTSTAVPAPPSLVFAEYDLILCRNMLIYCQMDLKDQILRRLCSCLTQGGYLVLGGSENLPPDLARRMVPLGERLKIYCKEVFQP